MYISPRTSRSTSLFKLSGNDLIVLTLFVISSPTRPSPRVAALTNFPFSYVSDTAKPSIFNSQTYSTGPTSFSTLLQKDNTSSSLNTSPRENIGVGWVILLNSEITVVPTLDVGELSNLYSGYFSSSLINSSSKESNSLSVSVGLSLT